MNRDALVSLVMAFWRKDNPQYFEASLRSVIESSYRPIEVVLVRDGEVPKELESVVHKFESDIKMDPDLKLKRVNLVANLGPGGARNKAIEVCSGEYIAILDSDDEMLKERIQSQVLFLKENLQIALVGTSYVCVDENGIQIAQVKLPTSSKKIRVMSSFINPIANPTVMARSEVLKKYRYPENLRFGEDYRLWITMLEDGLLLGNLDEFGIRFRSPSSFSKRRIGFAIVISELKNKLMSLSYQPNSIKMGALFLLPPMLACRLLPSVLVTGLYRIAVKIVSKLSQ